jgi:GTP cyclohydrolase II
MTPKNNIITFCNRTNQYFEFSNCYPRTIKINGTYWPSVQHYYQAQKFQQKEHQEAIRRAKTPEAALALSRTLVADLVPDWQVSKVEVMRTALAAKFKQNDDLQKILLATGNATLQKQSDTEQFWGITPEGKGNNTLGKLLMALREKLHDIAQMRIQAKRETPWMSIQKDVQVPTAYGDLRFNVYMDNKGKEHVAILFGKITSDQPVITRIHSECLTGDLFKSLKCDCGSQLESALQSMQHAAEQGTGGILLYMRDEGRGIGLGNKLRAYKFQEQGLDTNEANEVLGLPADARSYQLPAAILKDLNITQVQLITNNPSKIRGLEDEGIVVIREKIKSQKNPHNAHYIATKNAQMGHDIATQ